MPRTIVHHGAEDEIARDGGDDLTAGNTVHLSGTDRVYVIACTVEGTYPCIFMDSEVTTADAGSKSGGDGISATLDVGRVIDDQTLAVTGIPDTSARTLVGIFLGIC